MTHLRGTLDGLTFEWSGGAYIDVTFPGASGPADVINVYDYERGETTIRGPLDFYAVCQRYARELSDHDRRAFIEHSPRPRGDCLSSDGC